MRTYNPRVCLQGFATAWATLVTDVLAVAPEAQGRLLFDIMNEPDGRAPSHSFPIVLLRSEAASGWQCKQSRSF